MSRYIMEVLIQEFGQDGKHVERWVPVRASYATEPYSYETEDEAWSMLRICYPEVGSDRRRVREVGA